MKILHILCEGQTEEQFANSVLKKYLKGFEIVVKPIILVTSRKKNARGGLLNYHQAKTDLQLLIKQHSKKTYEQHYFTTMFDLYALPDDFPGYETASKISDCYLQVQKLEAEFATDISRNNFIPYIQLHEFEALVFCGLEHLLIDYPDMRKQVEELEKVLSEYDNNPEKINNSPVTAPSKRIIKALEQNHNYDKPKSGKLVTEKVGISVLKARCKHFSQWVEQLERLS
jgi:hypothetical protein